MLDLKPDLPWLEARVVEARALPSDTLLVVIAGVGLVVLLLLHAWWKGARRARALRRTIASLQAELQSSRMVLEEEIKWRRAAEKIGAQVAKPEVGLISLPPD